MPKFFNWDEDYVEEIEREFLEDRQTRRKRKKKARHEPKKAQSEVVNELADETGLAGGFETTYQLGKHEAGWLLESLQSFYFQDIITDVMAVVKGGKEASVYRCKAHHTIEDEWLAAKVYRPRIFRNLRNDKMYREGRRAIGADGKELNDKDWRALKAMQKGGNIGQGMSHTSWLMYEYKTLRTLYDAGASVPEPIAASENALLMSYLGDGDLPAPTLSEVRLQPEEVEPLFKEVMRNIDIMLQHGIIHGDLSAYNILYWEGDIVIIDFPQVVDIQNNRNARSILKRDIQRVCDYFVNLGLKVNANEISYRLWKAYGVPDANQEEVLVNILEAVSFDDYEPEDDR
jgi:RIO kinase 1